LAFLPQKSTKEEAASQVGAASSFVDRAIEEDAWGTERAGWEEKKSKRLPLLSDVIDFSIFRILCGITDINKLQFQSTDTLYPLEISLN
jgi:hypothetical protein